MCAMKLSRKRLLTKSPVRSRPRRVLRYTTSMSVQSPPGPVAKSAVPLGRWNAEESNDILPIELRALAQMANVNIKTDDITDSLLPFTNEATKSPQFERGRFYDMYSAKRNERLMRKLVIELDDLSFKKCVGTKPQSKSGRKSSAAAADFVVDRYKTQQSRYSLRSSTKENKKPPLRMGLDKRYEVNARGTDNVTTTKRVGGTKPQSKSGRKSSAAAADFVVDRYKTQLSRYSLRSSTKENKKSALRMSFGKRYEVNARGTDTVTTTRRVGGTKPQSKSGRKSSVAAADFDVDRYKTQQSRYSLRSSTKENKKPPLRMGLDKRYEVNARGTNSVTTTRRVARKDFK